MSNITDLKKAQKKKREKTDWAPEEIEQVAAKEMQEYKKKAEDEPDQLDNKPMLDHEKQSRAKVAVILFFKVKFTTTL